MYTYYLVRVVLENGDWGYLSFGSGGYYLNKDPDQAVFSDTKDEAMDYLDRKAKGRYFNGSYVNYWSCGITTVTCNSRR